MLETSEQGEASEGGNADRARKSIGPMHVFVGCYLFGKTVGDL